MIRAERATAAAGHLPRSSAPVARISLGALARNADTFGGAGTIADLRADAWGHGAAEVAAVLRAAGVEAIVADPGAVTQILDAGYSSAHVRASGLSTVDLDALYGLAPGHCIPVMRLCGTVLSTKDLLAGEGVSYGYIHRAAADTRVALVSGGYAQGLVRALGGRMHVAIGGRRHRVIGRIAMDACVVEIGDASVVRGDRVAFFGDPDDGDPRLDAWSDACGLTTDELVTAVGMRATREYAP